MTFLSVAADLVRSILHFTIFVMACRAVHHQRKEIKEMKATLRAYVEMA